MFRRSEHLRLHQVTHTRVRSFSCDQCDKTFSQKSSLNQHKRIHTSKMPYSCDQCGERFALKRDLKRHHAIHAGETPYSCDPSWTISIKQEEPEDLQNLQKQGPERKPIKEEPTNTRKAGIRAGYYPLSERQQVALLMKMTAEEPANSPCSGEQLGVIGCVDIKEEESV